MRTRALLWTNTDGEQHAKVNTLSPGELDGDLAFWRAHFPETRPELVEVEIVRISQTRDTDPVPADEEVAGG